ncbi:hypothetical protein [Burkholderia gladioli]|uniref:hypothetical protein n=1 Tax=Burkholderia gladioli TaxID=28095 RepID=UPI00163E4AE7|nr:hypothetical protein [Burkholderia gladioli]
MYTSSNPYLEIRGAYVLAKLALITDPENDMTYEALIDAQAQGYRDSCECDESGTDMDVPTFFADVKALRQEWLDGWRLAEESREMENCSSCRAARGDPCPIHG